MKTLDVGGRTVMDFPPVQPGWDFWPMWADGRWEDDTHQIIAEHAAGTARYVDIGAWVGPTVLWAAEAGAELIDAYEPDPIACGVLRANVALNRLPVTVHGAAVTVDGDPVGFSSPDWGESTSGIGRGDSTITVRAERLSAAVEGATFVKIDTEGAEASYLSEAAGVLHGLGCPVLLSLHVPYWHPSTDHKAVSAGLGLWSDRRVLPGAPAGFESVLLLP